MQRIADSYTKLLEKEFSVNRYKQRAGIFRLIRGGVRNLEVRVGEAGTGYAGCSPLQHRFRTRQFFIQKSIKTTV